MDCLPPSVFRVSLVKWSVISLFTVSFLSAPNTGIYAEVPDKISLPLSLKSLVQNEKPVPVLKGLAAVGSARYDFGSVQQNAELHHDFNLVNEAAVPIRITAMKTSCSCTWAKTNDNFVGSVLQPKEKLTFPAFFPTGTQQNTASGNIQIHFQHQKKAPNLVNDGKLVLEVTSTILLDYRLEPQELKLGNIHALETQKAKAALRIVPDQLKTLEVLSVKPYSELLTTKVIPCCHNTPIVATWRFPLT